MRIGFSIKRVDYSPALKSDLHGLDYTIVRSLILQLTADAMEGVLSELGEPCPENPDYLECVYVTCAQKWYLSRIILPEIIFSEHEEIITIISIAINKFDKCMLKTDNLYDAAQDNFFPDQNDEPLSGSNQRHWRPNKRGH